MKSRNLLDLKFCVGFGIGKCNRETFLISRFVLNLVQMPFGLIIRFIENNVFFQYNGSHDFLSSRLVIFPPHFYWKLCGAVQVCCIFFPFSVLDCFIWYSIYIMLSLLCRHNPQGIVPAKAAKMAAKSVTLMTEKLINIKVHIYDILDCGY